MFTDEEGYGKFFDLHALHEQYINLKGVERLDYLAFLKVFDQFSEVPTAVRESRDYKAYVVHAHVHMLFLHLTCATFRCAAISTVSWPTL
jgi:hypothetical protein